jgi:hypothetical protein
LKIGYKIWYLGEGEFTPLIPLFPLPQIHLKEKEI